MKNIILALLTTLFLLSCKKQNEIVMTNPLILKNGLLYQDSASIKPYTGRHKSKMLDMRIEYEVKDGIKNGDFIVYNSKGRIQMRGKIIDNKNEGNWKYYFQNGNLESEGFFNNDTVDGIWKWYDSNGMKRQEGFFNKGIKEGDWKKYDSLGKVKIIYKYRNDELIDSIVVN